MILAIADELVKGTIETVLAKSALELDIVVLLGPFIPDEQHPVPPSPDGRCKPSRRTISP
ncbi:MULTISPECIES: hypothetical protein [Streptosporangium]|uniref:Uncharacterized protein n=1 Tax=Streptosporangium brasiliense TaxID=47480 RepID=A0ABT9RHB9_9ACTN|nr:hypothetical protein [Streptosporangium brasiliense]MDP9868267.1 hypothetical protein [Streptosporangium brasiliense]